MCSWIVQDLYVDRKASFSLSYFYCWVWYHILIYIFKFCFCFSCPFFYSLVNAFLNISMLWNLCWFLIIHLLSVLNVSIVTFRLKNKKKNVNSIWLKIQDDFEIIYRNLVSCKSTCRCILDMIYSLIYDLQVFIYECGVKV